MAYEVITNVDKFNSKVSVEMNKKFVLEPIEGASLSIKYVSKNDTEGIFIDYYYSNTNNDFLYLDGCDMIIRLDDLVNIKLPFSANGERMSLQGGNYRELWTEFNEYNYVSIDKSTLEKICDARSIEIKMNGRNSIEYSSDECQGLIEYCRLFYNSLYNTDRYIVEDEELYKKENQKKREKQQMEKDANTSAMLLFGLILLAPGIVLSYPLLSFGWDTIGILLIIAAIVGLFLIINYFVKSNKLKKKK